MGRKLRTIKNERDTSENLTQVLALDRKALKLGRRINQIVSILLNS